MSNTKGRAGHPHENAARQGTAARPKGKNEDADIPYTDGGRLSSSRPNSAAADFTKSKMTWLDAIASDADVPHAAFRVAYVLVSRYLNRRTGTAWPSLTTLADDIGTDARTVSRHLSVLEGRGYLAKKRGGDGRPNTYAMVVSDQTKMSGLKPSRPDKNVRSERGGKVISDRTNSRFQTGQNCPTNPYREPFELRGEPYRLPPIEPLKNSFGEHETGGSAPEALPPCSALDDLGPGEWEPCFDEPEEGLGSLEEAPVVIREFHESLPARLRSAFTYGPGGYIFADEPDVELSRRLIPLLRRYLGEDGTAVVSPFDDRYDLACLLSEAEGLVDDLDEAQHLSARCSYDADPQYA